MALPSPPFDTHPPFHPTTVRYTSCVKRIALLAILAASACAQVAKSPDSALPLSLPCPSATHWDGKQCTTAAGVDKLEEAIVALEKFEVDKALRLLEAASSEGPYGHADLIKLHKHRAIVYAYLDREEEALQEFAILLALEPRHLLRHTLSPKATLLFEQAREASTEKQPALIDLSWPQDLKVSDELPLAVEVIADPQSWLHRMALFVRSSSEEEYRRITLDLPKPGEIQKLRLPAANTKRPTVLQIYGKAYDAEGHEVMLWFDSEAPREIPLSYQAKQPWYRKWWTWAAIGGVVAAGTGTTVYLLSIDPPDRIDGGFDLGFW
mgnify:CR=1 FL=1